MPNWIDRRASRESNLENGSVELWQKVATAIDNTCQSFKKHYSNLGEIEFSLENGHRLIVVLSPSPGGKKRYAVISYDDSKQRITVTIDDGTPKHFPIDADTGHCYIKSATDTEISVDDFAKEALEDMLFKKKRA